MLDLSQENRGNKFLEYCRFPLEQGSPALRRKYLIPCFVGDCCRPSGFDGIKYYGTREYTNYVTWHDGYFTHVQQQIGDIK